MYWASYGTVVEYKCKAICHVICAYNHKCFEQNSGTLMLSLTVAFGFYGVSMHECLWKITATHHTLNLIWSFFGEMWRESELGL